MDTNETITSDELAAYVAGQLEPAQVERVERWAALDPANAEELRRLQDTWNMVVLVDAPTSDAPDVDRAWNRLNARIAEADVPRIRPLWDRVRPWLAAAAMLAVVFTVYRLWVIAPTVHLAERTARAVTLEDGSMVVLSAGAELSERMDGRRRIELTGAAYFDVQHDPERPFEVRADDVLVTVLGTSFEVRTATDTSTFVVRVRSGSVRVEAAGEVLVLQAGDRARYDQRLLRERSPEPPVQVWGDRVLQFAQAPLSRVVEALEGMYGVKITLANPALERCQLTAEFDNEPISTILQVIAETFSLEVREPTTGAFELRGDGC